MPTNWISSAGGPLVLCTAAAAKAWQGVHGADYDLACSVDGYLGVVEQHGHQYLVFADEPLETTLVEEGEGLAVVQWEYCDSMTHALELLAALPEQLEPLAPIVDFELASDGAILFDSGAPGGDIRQAMRLSLPASRYAVSTGAYAGPGFRFLVHRFRQSGVPS
jgi:hypothetical protein